MLAICAYYAGIMLNSFATYYAHNYAGIIGSSLVCVCVCVCVCVYALPSNSCIYLLKAKVM